MTFPPLVAASAALLATCNFVDADAFQPLIKVRVRVRLTLSLP